jgi:hypothetical protein
VVSLGWKKADGASACRPYLPEVEFWKNAPEPPEEGPVVFFTEGCDFLPLDILRNAFDFIKIT